MDKQLIDKLKVKFGEKIREGVLFRDLTTVAIGGPAAALLIVESESEIVEAIRFARDNNIPFFCLGGGSNLLVADSGIDSLIIKIELKGIKAANNTLIVQAGTPLQELIDYTITHGLSGIHKMTGIPGTVGGAIYGNAGAYGQTISDYLDTVTCFNGEKIITLNKAECNFEYRTSGFKTTKFVIISATFKLTLHQPQILEQEASEKLALRIKKYPVGIKCPGSFFRNFFTSEIPTETTKLLPPREDTFGKLPAYIFIEELGLKGKRVGDIQIAPYHGNLFVNLGNGTAADFWKLGYECFIKTWEKYHVELIPEVQLVNLPAFSNH